MKAPKEYQSSPHDWRASYIFIIVLIAVVAAMADILLIMQIMG